jgi:UDP-N-acetylglucosamine diphosphorylase/glucosamine-1-phosphate N-acetyltransferase
MADSICIFEDDHYGNFLPLTYFRPVYDLRCGMTTLREKILRSYPGVPARLHCRRYLTDLVREQNLRVAVNSGNARRSLFINGRLVAEDSIAKRLRLKGNDVVFLQGDTVVAARVSDANLAALDRALLTGPLTADHFSGLPREEVEEKLVRYPWDLVANNGSQIAVDFKLLVGNKERIKGRVYPGVHLIGKSDIFVDTGAKVKPGVVLDAENGPIFIGKGATVFPNAVVEGPTSVGEGSLIKVGAKIYENTTIGEVCKVGGEVEASIIHGYSNKQHDGFLGHAYLGMWVNLGADTNNSDLKNNYGSVKVVINGQSVDSGSMFVGLTMGDHSKSGINTMFNTGTVVGVSCNVYGADFPPKYIPSFCWGGSQSLSVYELDKSVDVARRVMARRKRVMSEAEERMFHEVFEITREDRSRVTAHAMA